MKNRLSGLVYVILCLTFLVSFSAAGQAESSENNFSDPFIKGSRYWSLATSASRDYSLGSVYLTQIHVNYYFAHNLAISYGGEIGYINGKRTKGGVIGGPQIGLRWHFVKIQKWSIYMEGLVGAVAQQQPLTEQSLRFNFDLEPGGGFSYSLNQKMLLQSGFRWHHLSNARVRGKEHNVGYDGPMVYLQFSHSF